MAVRNIDLEPRLGVAVASLGQSRSRSTRVPASVTQRQRGDKRARGFNSTNAASIYASITALGAGAGADAAIAAASGSTSGPPYWKLPGGGDSGPL